MPFFFALLGKYRLFCPNILIAMKKNIIVCLLFILINSMNVIGCYAFFNRDVHLLTMQDGLADNKVNCIYKDKDGFMWFGTDNGLSRYDGSFIRNFNLESISYTNVSAINELSDHCLGIMLGKTLHGFNRLTEKFVPIEIDGTEQFELIQFITKHKNRCWIIGTDQLSLCHIQEKKDEKGNVIRLVLNVEQEIRNIVKKGNRITHCCFSNDREEVYMTDNHLELIVYDIHHKKVRKRMPICHNPSAIITAILEYDNIIWVATRADGITRYHKCTERMDHISYGGEGKENLLSHTDVYDIVPINNGRLLAVTWNGYTILTPKNGSFEELATNIYNNVTLINQNLETRMISVYYDLQGILWIGTHGGGVMFSDLRLQYFNQFHQNRHNEICGITADGDGYIWLATFHKGIMKSSGPFNSLAKLEFETVGNNEVKNKKTVLCLFKDKKGNIWFGNQDGTLTFYNRQGVFQVCALNIDSLVNRASIWSLYIDSKDNFWVGTDNGLLLYDPLSGKCRRMCVQHKELSAQSISIRTIAETANGKIWVGTEYTGLGKVINGREISFGYGISFHLQNSSVRSLYASSDGFLYIGSEKGMGIMDVQKEVVNDFYTTQNGLCNNYIGCIVEDSNRQIWVGSNSGISRYSRHQKQFYHYYISGSNRFAFLYDDHLFWGNNKSLTYFNPENINAFPFSEQVAITSLEVGNKTVHIGEEINGQVILNENLFYSQVIKLNHENRDFSLTFNNLSFSEGQQKYCYRLYPYQPDWLFVNERGKVSYANLPVGKYTFEIKNIYPNEKEGKITSLRVEILPHWTETFLFRFCIIILAVVMIYMIIHRFKLRQKRMKHELQLEQEVFATTVERDKEKQIRIEREKFFTNVAHELRTPLTLILSPLQELLHSVNSSDAIYEKLSMMYRNGASLHTLVDHLLYVQKIEAGMVKLSISQVDIVKLASGVADSFKAMAVTNSIDFEIEFPQDEIQLWIDIEKITSAMRNILSNAFKYTSPEGKVRFSIEQIEIDDCRFCKLMVSDTGKGIPEELQERIFESFITGENIPLHSTKVGIGLRIVKNTMDLHHGSVTLESDMEKGSTFTLLIPEGKAHFARDKYETINVPMTENNPVLISTRQSDQEEGRTMAKKHLLVIEDNKEVRSYICSLFRKGYIIFEADNGEEGLRIAAEQAPDLIILDVMMPIKDGFTCCQELRVHPRTAHIPILMLTAKAEDEDVLNGSKAGADEYMMKPFNPEILKSKVENLILQRERLKRIYTKTLMLKQQDTSKMDSENNDTFIQQVIHVVEENLSNENFNVKILADQLNMSQPTLYRKIKQRSELNAIEIIRSVRMSKAASLIMENKYSMQEIAEMVGYSDTRTLRKHFSEQFGVSPSKYMEKE